MQVEHPLFRTLNAYFAFLSILHAVKVRWCKRGLGMACIFWNIQCFPGRSQLLEPVVRWNPLCLLSLRTKELMQYCIGVVRGCSRLWHAFTRTYSQKWGWPWSMGTSLCVLPGHAVARHQRMEGQAALLPQPNQSGTINAAAAL